jgi:hypothetical protein
MIALFYKETKQNNKDKVPPAQNVLRIYKMLVLDLFNNPV